ncbi:MAG: hypothetical protein ACQEWD_06730 [Bacteroidota bacterium]
MKKYSGANPAAINFQKTGKYLAINYYDNGKTCAKKDLERVTGSKLWKTVFFLLEEVLLLK